MRYLPHTGADRAAMLKRIGAGDINALFADIPAQFHLQPGSLALPAAKSEAAIVREFTKAAEQNRHAASHRCFLGGGTYHHFIPAVVDYVISRGEFLTAYTPYQPEISQGTLQALFEFQTMVARLLGMDISNASMYDAATSVAEAALMARRVTRCRRVIAATSVNPRYRAVCENYLSRLDGEYCSIPCADGFHTDITPLVDAVDDQTACVIVQYPDVFGSVYDMSALRQACDAHGALLVLAFSDASLFGILQTPGELGADIAVGSGQALGIPMAYGGPHLGLFTCRKKFMRQMPGRLCGMTTDQRGRRGFVLTLSTREQHIRREKATSNICSNQGLMCTAAATYMSLLGDAGLAQVGQRSAAAMTRLIHGLPAHVQAAAGTHFHETVISFASANARQAFLAKAARQQIFAGIPLERLFPDTQPRHLLVATTEMIEAADIDDFLAALEASR